MLGNKKLRCKSWRVPNSPSAINHDYNTRTYIYAYVCSRQSAIVARNYIHMHRGIVKNNAVEIKVTYIDEGKYIRALQMSLEPFSWILLDNNQSWMMARIYIVLSLENCIRGSNLRTEALSNTNFDTDKRSTRNIRSDCSSILAILEYVVQYTFACKIKIDHAMILIHRYIHEKNILDRLFWVIEKKLIWTFLFLCILTYVYW